MYFNPVRVRNTVFSVSVAAGVGFGGFVGWNLDDGFNREVEVQKVYQIKVDKFVTNFLDQTSTRRNRQGAASQQQIGDAVASVSDSLMARAQAEVKNPSKLPATALGAFSGGVIAAFFGFIAALCMDEAARKINIKVFEDITC